MKNVHLAGSLLDIDADSHLLRITQLLLIGNEGNA
jgi:hypothetical protein